jgi:hypothetical protein
MGVPRQLVPVLSGPSLLLGVLFSIVGKRSRKVRVLCFVPSGFARQYDATPATAELIRD